MTKTPITFSVYVKYHVGTEPYWQFAGSFASLTDAKERAVSLRAGGLVARIRA